MLLDLGTWILGFNFLDLGIWILEFPRQRELAGAKICRTNILYNEAPPVHRGGDIIII